MFAFTSTVIAALIVSTFAIPMPDAGTQPFTLKNGKDAIALNKSFKGLEKTDPCKSGQDACIGKQFAQCANDAWVVTPCGTGTICAALPLVNSPGTSVTCSTAADRDARIKATGAA